MQTEQTTERVQHPGAEPGAPSETRTASEYHALMKVWREGRDAYDRQLVLDEVTRKGFAEEEPGRRYPAVVVPCEDIGDGVTTRRVPPLTLCPLQASGTLIRKRRKDGVKTVVQWVKADPPIKLGPFVITRRFAERGTLSQEGWDMRHEDGLPLDSHGVGGRRKWFGSRSDAEDFACSILKQCEVPEIHNTAERGSHYVKWLLSLFPGSQTLTEALYIAAAVERDKAALDAHNANQSRIKGVKRDAAEEMYTALKLLVDNPGPSNVATAQALLAQLDAEIAGGK